MKVKERSRKFDRTIVWRDVREAVAGLFGAGVMVWMSILAPGWLPKVGAAAAVVSVAYVIARLSRVRRAHETPHEHLPLVERLRAEIAKVEAQAELLRSVRSWYVTPLAVGATVWLASLVPAIGLPAGATFAALACAVAFSATLFSAVGWFVVTINRRAVCAGLEPYMAELRRMLREAQPE
jgi:hypothetical protein